MVKKSMVVGLAFVVAISFWTYRLKPASAETPEGATCEIHAGAGAGWEGVEVGVSRIIERISDLGYENIQISFWDGVSLICGW